MIVDSHTHIFDPTRPQGVPWPNPKDEWLYRTVLPEHVKAATASSGVTGMVVIEASAWVEDNAWVLDLAADDPFIVGVVGHLEPGDGAFGRDLDRFAANPLFRGIRIGAGLVERVDEPAVAADVERLAAKGLELDVLVQAKHLPAVAALAARLPELHIGINHVAAVFIDGHAPNAEWVDGMQAAAAHANVWCKVSALTSMTRQTPAPTDVALYAPTLDALWDAFGEDRLVYGSDWPVCARAAEYPVVHRIVAEYFGAKGEAASAKYFWQNSKALYGWVER